MTQLTTRSPPPKLIGRGYSTVQPETTSWLNESRGSLGAAQSRFNDISSMDVAGAGALFMSAEYAVKAVIVEHYGFLPPSFKTHHRIVNLSHLIGLWWQLPLDLRAHLADIAPLDPIGNSAAFGKLTF
jgi:hypothetical protein